LNDAQAHKLRLLSLLTLAPAAGTLTYPSLLKSLPLPTTRALEDLLIAAIYASLLTGTLSSSRQGGREGRIDTSSLSPLRDLKPGSVPLMVKVLEEWDARCEGVLGELETKVRGVRTKAGERRRREEAYEGVVADRGGEEGKVGGVKREGEGEEGRKGKRGGRR